MKESDQQGTQQFLDTIFDGVETDSSFIPDEALQSEAEKNATLCITMEGEALEQQMRGMEQDTGITRSTLFLEGFAYSIAKYTGQEAALFCVAGPGNRRAVYQKLEEEQTITASLKALQAYENHVLTQEEISFETMISSYQIPTNTWFTYQEEGAQGEETLQKVKDIGTVPDVWMQVEKKGMQYKLEITYQTALYKESTMRRFAMMYQQVIGAMLSERCWKDISLATQEELQILDKFNETEADYDHTKTVVDLFLEQARENSQNIAVVYKEKRITYSQAEQVTGSIAAYIQGMGLQKEDVVSVLIPRCEYMALASMGILRSGAAYQPLDPSYPPERLQFMMEDANAKLLIADESLLSLVPDYQGPVLTLDAIEQLSIEKTAAENLPKPEDLMILLYTSGSTGVPKGCMLEHRNLTAFCHWYQDYYKLTSQGRVAAYASYGFDANMMDMYPALTCGASVYIIEENIRLDLQALNAYFIEQGITHSFMTTQIGRTFATSVKNDFLQYLSVGGEKLVPFEPHISYPFFNGYGPTECTIFATTYRMTSLKKNVPIGKPLSNVKLYVIDSQGRRMPIGVPGELCIAGYQVSRGYLNRPDKTAESYTTNPFCSSQGYDRIYHTGDVVRFLEDGNVEFIGRRDGQVKIRGFRIELTEVEGVIREFDGIKDATVVAYDDPAGGKYITAYIVSDTAVDIEMLNQYIRENKPAYMVPAVTMQIEKIPLNQNQKVNKRMLPMPKREIEDRKAPENEQQQRIFACISDAIGHEEFGVDTNIYDAGLTSIGAVKLNVSLANEFQVVIKNKDLQKNDTVQKLEQFLKGARKTESYEKQEAYPLTQTQNGIFVECVANPGSTVYNLPFVFELSDKVNLQQLKKAIEQAVAAHPYVKTTLFMDEEGDIWQKRNDDAEFEVEIVHGWQEDQLVKPFDLMGGRLFRITLYVTDEKARLFMDFHHIINDGTSYSIFLNDVNAAYAGQILIEETYSGFEVAIEEQKLRKTTVFTDAENYYDSIFKNCDTDFLPSKDKVEPRQSAGNYALRKNIELSGLEKFCAKQDITMNVLFTAAFGLIVGKYVYKEDAVFAAIYDGRNDGRLERTVNMLVKTLPVYCSLEGEQTIADYLKQMKEQLMNSMANDLFSFAEISHKYGIRSDILFAYQGDSFAFDTMGMEPCTATELTPDTAMAPLSVDVFIKDGALSFEVNYRSDWYEEASIAGMMESYANVIESIQHCKQLKEVSLLSGKAEAEVLSFNQTEVSIEHVTANILFERQVSKYPDKTAVIAAGEKRSFRELNEAANKIANSLLELGLKQEQMVGLMLPRTVDVYAVRQGILKSGGAFLPLDPDYPDDRITYILEDSKVPFLIMPANLAKQRATLTGQSSAKVLILEELLKQKNTENPKVDIEPENLCYCIYTSGSTGKPKGVMIEHRNLVNYVDGNAYNLEAHAYIHNTSVVLAFAAITFDVSILEECIPLYHGITVCMATEEEIHNPLALSELMIVNKVDVLTCTPSFIMNIIDAPEMSKALSQIKMFNIGAEAFPATLYQKIRKLGTDPLIFNGYGPTETTIGCAFEQVTGEKITIGVPMGNIKMLIVDSNLNLLPAGVPGELLIMGAGVGRGYVGKPELTAEKFITYRGLPAYHSGDLAKWNHHGKIEFSGRMDNQVKLRGLRVELDEIENVMNEYPGINASVVLVKENESGQFLCGYFTAAIAVEKQNLTSFLQKYLTPYMVPGVLIQLEELPLTNNGKVDKKALPEPEYEQESREYTAPETKIQKELCQVFEMALGMEKIGIEDNFFDIGGTSLSASKVAMKCMSLGLAISYSDLFQHSTVKALETFLKEKGESAGEEQAGEKTVQSESKTEHTKFEKVLKDNVCERVSQIEAVPLGDVLLTGATGFLGAHVLHDLIEKSDSQIYCLIRGSEDSAIENRLKRILVYYFDQSYGELFGNRIQLIEGDITDEKLSDKLQPLSFDKIINCAACVKHFAADDILERINFKGVENLIQICMEQGRSLIQVSTVSIAGENVDYKFSADKKIHENEFDFGQSTSNQYIDTKFRAEEAVLQAMTEGMRGKIMRVGNLMSRAQDGEFQINSVTNGFMRTLRGYAALGQFPVSAMDAPTEFSPIDLTAAAIIRLCQTDDSCSVFHPYSSYIIQMADVVEQMNACGIPVKVVEEGEFEETLQEALKDEEKGELIAGLIAYLSSSQEHTVIEIDADNSYTTKVLYRLGFKWRMPDEKYLRRSIDALNTLGFFE